MKSQGKPFIKNEGEFVTVFLPIVFFKEKGKRYFMAACPPLDIYSAGKTIEEAEAAIDEHIELFFDETIRKGTLHECLVDLGWKFNKNKVPSINPPLTTFSDAFSKFGNHQITAINRQTNIPVHC